MKTALMFAGVDALDLENHRKTLLTCPEVRGRLKEAQGVLESFVEDCPDLTQFMALENERFHSDFTLKSICATASQVGLYDRWVQTHAAPDFILGCSLGDNARTICSGAVSFETILKGTYLFGSAGQAIQGGAMIRVRAPESLTPDEEKGVSDYGLTIAVHQTPRHFLISGPKSNGELWVKEEANKRGYKTQLLHDKPLHSPHMKSALSAVQKSFGGELSRGWNIPMVSTVFKKIIRGDSALRADLEQNMTGSVKWWQSFQWMIEELGISSVVNVGPVTTLISFVERTPLSNSIQILDAAAEVFA
jgi:[acyl-carrier-protein] S-malonyltransferase